MEKNTGRRQKRLSNEPIVISDTSSEDEPTPKRFKHQGTLGIFSSPLFTSTPFVTRTAKPFAINAAMRLRSSGILQKNATTTTTDFSLFKPIGINLKTIAELPPIEIDDDSSNQAAQSDIEQIEERTQKKAKVVLQKMTPEYIQRMLNNINDVGIMKTRPKKNSNEVSEIDFKSWQWQPRLKLTRVKHDSQHELLKGTKAKVQPAKPLTFDRDESLIREISPDRAHKSFQQRIKVIKESLQRVPVKAINLNRRRTRVKRTRNDHYKEYEETHKKLQKTRGKHAKKSVGRKLYNHGESYEGIDEIENSE